ncbi:hypothetical protein [Streptomyces lincolnensis]|uniref:hypothetical protein n=1 Tax=Streptomyces lincolnensis TaxID=1915 RepID=UPI00126015AC|nr:hypothetical protein [Streptomyces lincolnensis]QMV08484.1 hypothetical protein GJU35_24480 [Streptomyces lincolnensis]
MAAVGLGVTAWGTVKSSQVADDQLDQSREQQLASDRQQVAQVNFWVEGGKTVIANRSLDPVSIYFSTRPVNDPAVSSPFQWLSKIPPCKRVLLPDRLLTPNDRDPQVLASLLVIDTDGRAWLRDHAGRIDPASADVPIAIAPVYVDRLSGKDAQATDLDTCGSP